MQVLIPDMQPIKIYRTNTTPDYQTYFPNMDNVLPGTEWVPGVYATKYFADWLVNKIISIQLKITLAGTEDLSVYKYNTSTKVYDLLTTVSPTVITPTGWQLDPVYRYDYTPTTEGVYYFESTTANIRSYKFAVHSDLKFRKRLCEIVYYNFENDYGMVFFDGIVQRYTGRAYFTGALMSDSPGNEISAFTADRHELEKLRSTPFRVESFQINDIHYSEKNRVNLILSNSSLTINGVTYQTEEAPEIERIANSDLVNITVKVTQTNYNYTS